MKKIFTLMILMCVMFTASSCSMLRTKSMDGDGNVLERTFKIEQDGVWELNVEDINISASNVEAFIRTGSVYGNALKIATDDNVFTSLTVTIDEVNHVITVEGDEQISYSPTEFAITLGVPFGKLDIDGGFVLDVLKESGKTLELDIDGAASGTIVTEPLDTLMIEVNGAAELELTGRTNNLLLDGEGMVNIDAKSCEALNANIKLEGAANASIYVTGELYAEASGTCAITCKGNPTVKQQSINGLSTLTME